MFSYFSLIQYRNITKNCNKTSCCIVVWSHLKFLFELDFLLPKNVISFDHLWVFSWSISKIVSRLCLSKICKIILKNSLKYSQLMSASDNKKIWLTTRNVRLDSGHYATKYYCYQKLFWPITVWINCSSDLKNFANSPPPALNFKSFSQSLEQFFSHSRSEQFW